MTLKTVVGGQEESESGNCDFTANGKGIKEMVHFKYLGVYGNKGLISYRWGGEWKYGRNVVKVVERENDISRNKKNVV